MHFHLFNKIYVGIICFIVLLFFSLQRPLESDIYAADGGNVTIACNPEAAPRPKYVWRKDGFTIGSGGRRIILPSGHLLINPVSLEDVGNFTCTAENR